MEVLFAISILIGMLFGFTYCDEDQRKKDNIQCSKICGDDKSRVQYVEYDDNNCFCWSEKDREWKLRGFLK